MHFPNYLLPDSFVQRFLNAYTDQSFKDLVCPSFQSTMKSKVAYVNTNNQYNKQLIIGMGFPRGK